MKTQIEQVVIWEDQKRRERERRYEETRIPAYAPPPPEWRQPEEKKERGVTTWQM